MKESFRRPHGANDDGAATVRNVLPWRNMEKELAKRLAAKAARGELVTNDLVEAPRKGSRPEEESERAPDSGVRKSASFGLAPVEKETTRPLTYSMYTVSELDEVRPPPRLSMAVVSVQPSRMAEAWAQAWRSGLVALRTLWSWVRTAKPRPRPMDVCRVPLVAFGADLREALRLLPWKKIGWASAFGFGAIMLSLFAVVTVAELTDDLKPTRSVSANTGHLGASRALSPDPAGGSATNENDVGALSQPPRSDVGLVPAQGALPQPARSDVEESSSAQIEIDDDQTANAKPAATMVKAAPKPSPKRPKPVEIFNP